MTDDTPLQRLFTNGELKPLIQQVLKIKTINDALKTVLPAEFSEVEANHMEAGSIVLDVPHAAMLTVLRYQTPELLNRLRQIKGLAGISGIKLRVAPKSIEKPEILVEQPPRTISAEASQLLQDAASDIEDDALKRALMSLASHIQS